MIIGLLTNFNIKYIPFLLKSIQSLHVLDTKFSKDFANNAVLFETSTTIWNQFKQQFSIKEIVSRNEDTILAWVNCTRFDAYYIAYQLAPLAKIIAPNHISIVLLTV